MFVLGNNNKIIGMKWFIVNIILNVKKIYTFGDRKNLNYRVCVSTNFVQRNQKSKIPLRSSS